MSILSTFVNPNWYFLSSMETKGDVRSMYMLFVFLLQKGHYKSGPYDLSTLHKRII